jgi:hypothetical protein
VEPLGWFELEDAAWYGLDEDAAAMLCTGEPPRLAFISSATADPSDAR